MIFKWRNGILLLLVISVIFIAYQQSNRFTSVSKGYLLNTLIEDVEVVWNNSELLNLKSFKYIINNDKVCQGGDNQNLSIIQIVTSFAGNVESRSAIRRAYPKSELDKLGIARVFLLANLRDYQSDVKQTALLHENKRYHDLVQGNFFESYKNLTYKHVMGLKWAVTYCPEMSYIIKMDDDIVVNMYKLVDIIHHKFTQSTDMMGYQFRGMKPIRMKANKWYVSKLEYRGNSYPTFLSGWMYVTTPAVAARLVEFAHRLPYFWIDDLFITGIVATQLGSSFKDIGHYFTTHPEILECCIQQHVKCQYIVAPDGGDNSLQVRYQKYLKKCQNENVCKVLKGNVTIEDTCVAKRKLPPLTKGIPSLKIIKLW